MRERWTLVQAQVLQLRESGKEKDRKAALKAVQDYHEWLCGLRILDPACGSGNFLCVTLHLLKRIELEVLQLENELRSRGDADFRLFEVHPRQFHGIEVKPWAREIAELTLWIGYHQFWKRHRHVEYPEPILEDTGTIECRDAVLAWDAIRHDPTRDRPDPTPRIVHPVTGELVPDPAAKLEYMEYVNPRKAEWPRADFIVGNPPYIGGKRIRVALGDGYADALQEAYSDVPDAADLVMRWVERAANAIANTSAVRAGLITTNSLRQMHNRPVIAKAIERGVNVQWVVPDHPWVQDADGAAVRVALIVLGRTGLMPKLVRVQTNGELLETIVQRINPDMTAAADLTSASSPSRANEGLCSLGFLVNGSGFFLDRSEAEDLIAADARNGQVIKPFFGGKDLTARFRAMYVIDFGARSLEEARTFPLVYGLIADRVKPIRDANRDRGIRENWWRFHRIRVDLRNACLGLRRYIVTVETAKHRMFCFLASSFAPDHMLVCVASEDAFHLGVLSSKIHTTWALAAGATLEDRPRYTKTLCFDPFPFPDRLEPTQSRVAEAGERIDAHRQSALARDPRVTMTGMYNVVEKLRARTALTPKERTIHELAACGVLRDLHDELDALVAQAYGWPWPMEKEEILERLVALHDERVAEEQAGKVRWLRPDYQIPRFGKDLPAGGELPIPITRAAEAAAAPVPWPRTAIEQLGAVKALLATRVLGAADVMAAFDRADPKLVARHLETLALMGELIETADGRYSLATSLGTASAA